MLSLLTLVAVILFLALWKFWKPFDRFLRRLFCVRWNDDDLIAIWRYNKAIRYWRSKRNA